MKILGLGPYIGNFETEVTEFRPYVKWVSEIIDYDEICLYTHKNRFFLYDWIKEDNKIPISEILSFDETNQTDHRNKNFAKSEFQKLRKVFKKEIFERVDCRKSDIDVYTLNYTRNAIPCPFHNKIYSKIEMVCSNRDHIFFIPTKNDQFNKTLIKRLSEESKVEIFDDSIDKKMKYEVNLLKMLQSKFVVCELSYWTFLCNLQQIPIFSWGKSIISPYKKGGILNFGNKSSMIFFEKGRIETILKMLDYFIRGLD